MRPQTVTTAVCHRRVPSPPPESPRVSVFSSHPTRQTAAPETRPLTATTRPAIHPCPAVQTPVQLLSKLLPINTGPVHQLPPLPATVSRHSQSAVRSRHLHILSLRLIPRLPVSSAHVCLLIPQSPQRPAVGSGKSQSNPSVGGRVWSLGQRTRPPLI